MPPPKDLAGGGLGARITKLRGAAAAYVPGHGAGVDAAFVRRQATWFARRAGQ